MYNDVHIYDLYIFSNTCLKYICNILYCVKIFTAAVRLNKDTRECTDSEIICFIKAWLVRSKDRFNNNNKDKTTLRDETVQEATY